MKEKKYKILDKVSYAANSSLFKNVPLCTSPDNEITNTVRNRDMSTDKRIFKQFFPSSKKTLL